MKKTLLILLIVLSFVTIVGCGKKKDNKYGLEFKKDYESINGKENSKGKVHRIVTIDENNVFVETTAEEIVKKIENKDSFYVYFGSTLCPWCRSSIEMADKITRENAIEKVYYVDIWDDEGNEILRDKYTLNENDELELEKEGTEAYKKLLEYFDELLEDYNITSEKSGEEISTGEKRIYAPNYFYVSKGIASRMVTGTSPLQKDSREELTEEILNDEEKIFDNFFINACDESC